MSHIHNKVVIFHIHYCPGLTRSNMFNVGFLTKILFSSRKWEHCPAMKQNNAQKKKEKDFDSSVAVSRYVCSLRKLQLSPEVISAED